MSFGIRLKSARQAARLSARGLAERSGVSPMAISKYERDLMLPGSKTLLRLAEAVGLPLDYFFRPATVQVQMHAYRKHCSLGAKEEAAIAARATEWLERYLEVESLFLDQRRRFEEQRIPVTSLADVEQAALAVRVKWDLGKAPIENLMGVLEERGVKIGQIEGFEHFDACTLSAAGQPVLIVKKGLPGDRQRFDLAHELGHCVLAPEGDLDPEAAANRFAGAFLVPSETATRELGPSRTGIGMAELSLLKQEYGMSMQAWLHRAADLGIISPAFAQQYYRQFRMRGWHRMEPGQQFPSEQPLRLRHLVLRALSEDLISRSRAEELLQGPIAELDRQEYALPDAIIAAAGH
jgi:Zn-dependent peptidase ImmA (M78 family)/DNA-binding XRE family transcriptional regulator